jgi:hypothetical protein
MRRPDIEIQGEWDNLPRESDGRKVFDLASGGSILIMGPTSFVYLPGFRASPYKIASFNQGFHQGRSIY